MNITSSLPHIDRATNPANHWYMSYNANQVDRLDIQFYVIPATSYSRMDF